MIVQPDFLDHWKTRMLVTLTNDPAAPLMVIRLWAYCQQRRKSVFDSLPNETLTAICSPLRKVVNLFNVLEQCGFIYVKDGKVVVHDWEQVNRSLIASWNNGQRGGRPSSHKTNGLKSGYPQVSHVKPTPSEERVQNDKKDWVTHGFPSPLPDKERAEVHKKFAAQMRSLSDKMRGNKSES